MNRRQFLSMAGAFAGSTGSAFAYTAPDAPPFIRSLVIVDLDGGNDGLNTVIPIDDPLYRVLRPGLAVPKDRALTLDRRTALHPSLLPLMSAWHAGDMAIVQGVGHAAPNCSHYRSRQIWDTASDTHEYRSDGWLARVSNLPAADVVETGPFVASCKAAARLIPTRTATVMRLTLHGFDTHENQAPRHASLLAQFAEGLALLRASLMGSGDWSRTLVMTRSDFGRSARENAAGGTDHGSAAPHFLMGGMVRGGVFGAPPLLDQLDDAGGLPVGIDFRRLCATVLHANCVIDPTSILGQRFEPLPLLRV